MTTDLEQLLRDTLTTKSAEVEHGPQWTGAPERKNSPWKPVLAAAAAVALLAGGGAWLASRGDHSTPPAGGVPTACETTLPAAWTTALTARPLSFDGHDLDVLTVTSDGDVIGVWTDGVADVDRVIEVPRQADPGQLFEGDPSERLITADADGSTLVVGLGRDGAGVRPRVTHLVTIDLGTGAERDVLPLGHLMPSAGERSRLSFESATIVKAVVQDDAIYFLAEDTARRGTVWSWSASTHRFDVVGHTTDHLELNRDTRGVNWPGGAVPADHVPAGLPTAYDTANQYEPVLSDGRSVAWTDHSDPFTVHWTDGETTRAWRTHVAGGRPYVPIVDGVAGPFVFFTPNESSRTYVLDTRTGAWGRAGEGYGGHYASRGYYLYEDSAARSVPVDTNRLPALSC